MKAIRLKSDSEGFASLSAAIKETSMVLATHTPMNLGYSFYRGHIHATNHPYIVGLRLLCSDKNGNFSVQNLEMDLQTKSLYYPHNMSLFEKEEDVKAAIENLIKSFEHMPYEVSQLYFDFVSEDEKAASIAACYMVRDADDPGSIIAFATMGQSFHYKYNLSEAKKLCLGTALHVNWRSAICTLLSQVNEGTVTKEVAEKELNKLGIKWAQ